MKKRWGDRKDARRVRDMDGFHTVLAHLYPKRTDSEVYMHAEMDAGPLLAYIREKNSNLADPRYRVTIFHTVVAAVAKVIKMRPLLNRFIAARRYFERDQITMSFVAKKQFDDHAEEALMILSPDDSYTLDDYTRKIVGEVRQARTGSDDYGADGILNAIARLPVFLVRFVVFLLRVLDNSGRLPDDIVSIDPNQTTVLLSNLGSIQCDAVYHHLNNFGTNSIIITIGEVHTVHELGPDGHPRTREILPMGVTIDERIADGFYFARSVKLIQYILAHPQLLDAPLGETFDYEQ